MPQSLYLQQDGEDRLHDSHPPANGLARSQSREIRLQQYLVPIWSGGWQLVFRIPRHNYTNGSGHRLSMRLYHDLDCAVTGQMSLAEDIAQFVIGPWWNQQWECRNVLVNGRIGCDNERNGGFAMKMQIIYNLTGYRSTLAPNIKGGKNQRLNVNTARDSHGAFPFQTLARSLYALGRELFLFSASQVREDWKTATRCVCRPICCKAVACMYLSCPTKRDVVPFSRAARTSPHNISPLRPSSLPHVASERRLFDVIIIVHATLEFLPFTCLLSTFKVEHYFMQHTSS